MACETPEEGRDGKFLKRPIFSHSWQNSIGMRSSDDPEDPKDSKFTLDLKKRSNMRWKKKEEKEIKLLKKKKKDEPFSVREVFQCANFNAAW